jgi:DNA adenine methylase
VASKTGVAGRPDGARPFLKWAGGKGQLLPELLARTPAKFNGYHEPFIGGGAFFLALRSRGVVTTAALSDANPRLVDTYTALRDDVEAVIAALEPLRNDRDLFYEVRARRHEDLSSAEAAARVIFLNKTCFNGLYRENRRGEFNVPFGRYTNPRICDPENLRAVSRALQGVSIERHDFDDALATVRAGDFVYLDPPYHPLSRTASFTDYHGAGFGESEQRRLAESFAGLAGRGVSVVASNSDTPLIRELYAGFEIEVVMAKRAINSKADARGKVHELIIRNFGA